MAQRVVSWLLRRRFLIRKLQISPVKSVNEDYQRVTTGASDVDVIRLPVWRIITDPVYTARRRWNAGWISKGSIL
jgi:hypothetical protein